MIPHVSVIVPNYNHAFFLKERIESVLNQSYQDFEMIILDDVSTDNSKEVIMQYENNPHVSHIVFNQENSGSPFKQWLKGMELAKGELIWVAESDDTCEKLLLEKLVDKIQKYENVSYCFCRSHLMNKKGFIKKVFQKSFGEKDFYLGRDFIEQKLIWGNCVVNASAVIFNKKKALSVSDEFMNFRGVGDWIFWTEMAELGNVAIVDEPLNNYRYYGNNTTSNNRKNGNEIKEVKSVFDYFKNRGHLGFLDEIRLRKKYIWHIKYEKHFSDETKQELLSLWGNNFFYDTLARISHLKH